MGRMAGEAEFTAVFGAGDLPLGPRLLPCGPVGDEAAAERAFEDIRFSLSLEDEAAAGGALEVIESYWPALAPIFANSPYLLSLAKRRPMRLVDLLHAPEAVSLSQIMAACQALAEDETAGQDLDSSKRQLRLLKADLHLLTALCDLGGVWSLSQVTRALSLFADQTCQTALVLASALDRRRGKILAAEDAAGPVPGLFGLAMGKHGAFELNYSSDIDVSLFYDPDRLSLSEPYEAQRLLDRLAQSFTQIMTERTGDGYVFRVDLRLRPDPSSTPPVVSVPAALGYYESVGQNWERAAFIKARAVMGDPVAAKDFLAELRPFVWRRSLDFAAVSDIHSIKRQIHVHKADARLTAAGANLKLGAGGIREIEFFAQTQQLILGGRDPSLRAPRTLEALNALEAAGHIAEGQAGRLSRDYERLRALEHRVQMLHDEQTHRLPEDDELRLKVAHLSGHGDLASFDAEVEAIIRRVNGAYGELFSEEEELSSEHGSLVFTGVDDDPETLETLARMGFSNPPQISSTIRSWHHGRIPATRTSRGRELFTRLAPKLLDAASQTTVPDTAFARFAGFFGGLSAGVQVQSLFLAQPRLFELIVQVMAFSPRLATILARKPAAFDALLDSRFFKAPEPGEVAEAVMEAVPLGADFEGAMNWVRRAHREQSFRIGLQGVTGAIGPDQAGAAYAELADACVKALAPVALTETMRLGGAYGGGHVAVIALGKFGSKEMTATSDLDLMTLYALDDPEALSEGRGWSGEMVFTRFTQRLIAALSAPTAEGELYEIDTQLRPSGAKGPVAVSLPAFDHYYAHEADTWEFLALTRARVAFATSPEFQAVVEKRLTAALRRAREPQKVRADVAEMRALMERERPANGFWDHKLNAGGQVDCEFAVQMMQLLSAHAGGPLYPGVMAALSALATEGVMTPKDAEALKASWSLHQSLAHLMRAAVGPGGNPEQEPLPFQTYLVKQLGYRDLEDLKSALSARRVQARRVFEDLVGAS